MKFLSNMFSGALVLGLLAISLCGCSAPARTDLLTVAATVKTDMFLAANAACTTAPALHAEFSAMTAGNPDLIAVIADEALVYGALSAICAAPTASAKIDATMKSFGALAAAHAKMVALQPDHKAPPVPGPAL